MPGSRPLPRSLIPLPGESLPGFLLRLSCRLNQSPARTAELTGLAPDGRSGAYLPVTLLAGVPDQASATFTRITRLTGRQAAQLGMESWRTRNLTIAVSQDSVGPGASRLNRQLILAPETRYCPECLAGNGTAIQDAFGGPWLKTWHLPVVFACPAHRRLLEHLCPECGQVVRGRRLRGRLLPALLAAGLHPAQCRTVIGQDERRHRSCCGNRLDQGRLRRPAAPELITLQHKILGLLNPGGPPATLSAGTPVRPDDYFADLRVLAHLACFTWPAARNLSPSEETAAAIDRHVDSLRQQARARQAGSPASRTRARFDQATADAAVSGGLASIADRILSSTRDQAREQLAPLLPPDPRRPGRTRWVVSMTPSASRCSDGLQAAVDPLLRTYTKAGGHPTGRRNAVFRPQRWGPENIPALLPEDWLARHFTPADGTSTRVARRATAVRLVQMVAGGSLREAASFLEIRVAGVNWPGPGTPAATVEAIARNLDDPATPLVNYQHRRQELRTWNIDEATWTGIIARLPQSPGPQQPDLGDRKRQLASVYVWTQVTSGEHVFAPRPLDAARLYDPRNWTNAWTPLDSGSGLYGRASIHYSSLKAELDALSTSLARAIDAQHP